MRTFPGVVPSLESGAQDEAQGKRRAERRERENGRRG